MNVMQYIKDKKEAFAEYKDKRKFYHSMDQAEKQRNKDLKSFEENKRYASKLQELRNERIRLEGKQNLRNLQTKERLRIKAVKEQSTFNTTMRRIGNKIKENRQKRSAMPKKVYATSNDSGVFTRTSNSNVFGASGSNNVFTRTSNSNVFGSSNNNLFGLDKKTERIKKKKVIYYE